MAMCDVAHYDAFHMAIRSNLWGMEMTALGTSLALPLLYVESLYGEEPLVGSKILILMAVHKCMKEQYWTISL